MEKLVFDFFCDFFGVLYGWNEYLFVVFVDDVVGLGVGCFCGGGWYWDWVVGGGVGVVGVG